MKSTGIVRRVDELGRVVVPKEIRNQFNISERDPIEIFIDGNSIVLRKFEPNCIFCGSSKKLITYNDKQVSDNCFNKLAKIREEAEIKD